MADIALTVLGRIAEYSVAPVGRQLSYVFSLNTNVETLKDEMETLGALKVRVQRRIDAATKKIEVIDPIVEKWLCDVGTVGEVAQKIIQEKDNFPKGCFSSWCLSLKSRHSISRSAKKKTPDIVKLQNQGLKFENLSCPAPPNPLIVGTSSSVTLHSRESMLNDIIKCLENEEVGMIAICGMGGAGKTTMMENVLKKLKGDKNKLFDEYARTDVSQKLDLRKIQSDIAEMLGLKLEENTKEVRAGKLHERLRMKKVLIILDDVWEEFDLKSLGIDLEGDHKRCKILYTSRIKGLWMDFESRRRELPLDVLVYDEAWNLFKEKVGNLLFEKPELISIAEDIVRECGGLPLSLVTLVGTLRKKRSKHTWDDTLLKLRTVQDVQGKVNEFLKRSYDHLDDDDAKSLFLLCSLFKEDSKIYVERLVDIGVGLRLYRGISSVKATRDRVFSLLEDLHACYLVSSPEDSYMGKYFIKVHDVVRVVAKSIASTERGALIFEDGDELKRSQEKSKLEHSRWIAIITKEINELPTKLLCPSLELFRSSDTDMQVSGSPFEGMVELQVLDIYSNYQTFTLSSLQYLKCLRTLCLRHLFEEDLTPIGDLLSLEILRINDNSAVEELPKEIGQLTNLMVLDLSRCRCLKKLSPGVISRLTNLEELYIENDIEWGTEGNASLKEFEALSKLHTLHIVIEDPRALLTAPPFRNLKKYSICIGNLYISSDHVVCNKVFAISLTDVAPVNRELINFLLYESESVKLEGASVKDMALNFLREGSQTIVKCLEIINTGDKGDLMDCTVASSLLCTLKKLKLESLHSIQHISCSLNAARIFGALQDLCISRCKALESIFSVSSSEEVAQRVHLTSPVMSD